MAAIIGLDCKLYRLTTGARALWAGQSGVVVSGAAPGNLSEVTRVKNITLPVDKTEIDASDRSCVFKKVLTGLKDAGVTVEMVYDRTDTHYEALRNAFFNDGTVALAILDGDKTVAGVQGLWADFEVLNFTRTEDLEGNVQANFSIKPSGASSVDPQWVVVST